MRRVSRRAVAAPAHSRSQVAPLPDIRMGLMVLGIRMKSVLADTEHLRSQDAAAVRRPNNHWDNENRDNHRSYWDTKNRDNLRSHWDNSWDSDKDMAQGSGVPSSPNAAQPLGRAV